MCIRLSIQLLIIFMIVSFRLLEKRGLYEVWLDYFENEEKTDDEFKHLAIIRIIKNCRFYDYSIEFMNPTISYLSIPNIENY